MQRLRDASGAAGALHKPLPSSACPIPAPQVLVGSPVSQKGVESINVPTDRRRLVGWAYFLLRIWRAEEVEWRCAAAVVATTSTLLLLLRLLLLRLLHLRRSSPSRAPVGGVDASPSSAAPREALPCEHRRRVVDGFAVGAKKGLVLRVGPTHAHARTHMQHARVVAAVAVVRRREREGEINFSSFAIFFSLLTAQ